MSNYIFGLFVFLLVLGISYLLSDNFNIRRIARKNIKEEELFFEKDFSIIKAHIIELCKTKNFKVHLANPSMVIISDYITLSDTGYFYKIRKEGDDIMISIIPRFYFNFDFYNRRKNKIEAIRSMLR